MSNDDRLDVIWKRCFENFEGHAIYAKISSKVMKPGVCGYFDEHGMWQQLVDLTNPVDLEKKGYGPVNGDVAYTEDPKGQRWETRMSSNMQKVEPRISAGVGNAGLPVDGSVTIGFRTSSGNGAIQLTEGDVRYRQAHPPSILYAWLVQNAKKLVENNPDTKGRKRWNSGRPFWIVTQAYDVKHRALALLTSREAEVTLSVVAKAEQVGQIEATANWWKSEKSGAWNDHEDESGIVICMNGISWQDTWYHHTVRPARHRPDQESLGGDDDEDDDVVLKPIEFETQDGGDVKYTVELTPGLLERSVAGVRLWDPERDGEEEEDEEGEDGEEERDLYR